jgi:quinol monooxygenase YgiN
LVVNIKVKPGTEAAFIEATLDNARNSILEPGVAQFDFLQDESDPTHFTLYESYWESAGMDAHREAGHYKRWSAAVAPLMAQPRQGVWHKDLQHQDKAWARA